MSVSIECSQNTNVLVSDSWFDSGEEFYETEFPLLDKDASVVPKKRLEKKNIVSQSNCKIDMLMSIYIPLISNNTTKTDIICLFELWNIGKVSVIDYVKLSEEEYSIYVHFSCWYDTDENVILQNLLNEGKSVKQYYNIPSNILHDLEEEIKRLNGHDEQEENEFQEKDYEEEQEYQGKIITENEFYWVLRKNTSCKTKQKINVNELFEKKNTNSISPSFAWIDIDYLKRMIEINGQLKRTILKLNECLNSYEINLNTHFYNTFYQIEGYEPFVQEDNLIPQEHIICGIEYENIFLHRKKIELQMLFM